MQANKKNVWMRWTKGLRLHVVAFRVVFRTEAVHHMATIPVCYCLCTRVRWCGCPQRCTCISIETHAFSFHVLPLYTNYVHMPVCVKWVSMGYTCSWNARPSARSFTRASLRLYRRYIDYHQALDSRLYTHQHQLFCYTCPFIFHESLLISVFFSLFLHRLPQIIPNYGYKKHLNETRRISRRTIARFLCEQRLICYTHSLVFLKWNPTGSMFVQIYIQLGIFSFKVFPVIGNLTSRLNNIRKKEKIVVAISDSQQIRAYMRFEFWNRQMGKWKRLPFPLCSVCVDSRLEKRAKRRQEISLRFSFDLALCIKAYIYIYIHTFFLKYVFVYIPNLVQEVSQVSIWRSVKELFLEIFSWSLTRFQRFGINRSCQLNSSLEYL